MQDETTPAETPNCVKGLPGALGVRSKFATRSTNGCSFRCFAAMSSERRQQTLCNERVQHKNGMTESGSFLT